MLILGAELEGRRVAVRIRGERVHEIAPGLAPEPAEEVLDARGGALLPGLHDHHLHLLAMAAALLSVRCGPPHVHDAAGLGRVLLGAPGSDWIRGVGYHESVAGELDRRRLDRWVGARPARIQQRSGRLWILSSAALRRLGLPERGSDGRFFDADVALRERLAAAGASDPPDLTAVGARLARAGVTGVTDATARNGPAEQAILLAAGRTGALPQSLRMMGGDALPDHPTRGELKIVLHEDALPRIESLAARIARAHDDGRAAAVHCVTRAEIVFAAAALREAGARSDRIEHASLADPDALKLLAELGLTVVTQPGFVAERGDAYLRDVPARERRWLYRGRGFLDAGVPLGGGTDAPFAEPDPWHAMRAAVRRATAGGAELEPEEALTPEEALALFTTPAEDAGGEPRRVVSGGRADLCLLDRPWATARERLRADDVWATWCAGRLVYLGEPRAD